jgi:hypothetical protein
VKPKAVSNVPSLSGEESRETPSSRSRSEAEKNLLLVAEPKRIDKLRKTSVDCVRSL